MQLIYIYNSRSFFKHENSKLESNQNILTDHEKNNREAKWNGKLPIFNNSL